MIRDKDDPFLCDKCKCDDCICERCDKCGKYYPPTNLYETARGLIYCAECSKKMSESEITDKQIPSFEDLINKPKEQK